MGDPPPQRARVLRCRYRNVVGNTARNLYPHRALGAIWNPGVPRLLRPATGRSGCANHDVTSLMTERTFTDTIFLLHRSRLPTTAGTDADRRDPFELRGSRIGRAVVRHGAAGAVRQSQLAVGRGRGRHPRGRRRTWRRRLRLHGADRARASSARSANRSRSRSARRRWSAEHRAIGKRVAGLGHRVHTHDPRTPVLFELARTARAWPATASCSCRRSPPRSRNRSSR